MRFTCEKPTIYSKLLYNIYIYISDTCKPSSHGNEYMISFSYSAKKPMPEVTFCNQIVIKFENETYQPQKDQSGKTMSSVSSSLQ